MRLLVLPLNKPRIPIALHRDADCGKEQHSPETSDCRESSHAFRKRADAQVAERVAKKEMEAPHPITLPIICGFFCFAMIAVADCTVSTMRSRPNPEMLKTDHSQRKTLQQRESDKRSSQGKYSKKQELLYRQLLMAERPPLWPSAPRCRERQTTIQILADPDEGSRRPREACPDRRSRRTSRSP